MKYVVVLIFLIGLCCQGALAKSLSLVCSDADGYSLNIDIDLDKDIIVVDGNVAEDVHVTTDLFVFRVRMGGDWWYHSINRTTGMLLVHRSHAVAPPPYRCERSNPKF